VSVCGFASNHGRSNKLPQQHLILATYCVGSPAAANAYADDAASNATGYTIASLANPTAVTAADTIDLLINTAVPTNCVVSVFAVVANVAASYA
jgi:hypothetical protein